MLSLWNMPIFFLLAGRNDFLVWLTGWSYGTFHVFHKWVARVSALMGMVHSVAYAVYMYQSRFFLFFFLIGCGVVGGGKESDCV